MSKRNRIIYVAFGLAISASTVLAQNVTEPIEQAERPMVVDQPDDGSDAEQGQSASDTKSGNLCGASYTLNCGPRSYPAGQERDPEAERRDQRDLIAQESMATSTETMALWTIIMGVAAILAAVAAGFAAYFARNTVLETRRIGEAQVRAYVTIDELRCEEGKECPTYTVHMRNTGSTPAKKMRFNIGWTPQKPLRKLELDGTGPFSQFDLGAGVGRPLTRDLDGLTGNNATNFFAGNFPLWVHGVIRYDDVFDTTRYTWFQYRLDGEVISDKESGIKVAIDQINNEST